MATADNTPSQLDRIDNRPIPSGTDEIRCFIVFRNERVRIPAFLEYYRKLGVNRFFFVDNNSDDGSPDLLKDQEDVHLFFAGGSYLASRAGVDWWNELLTRYGVGHWCLTVDVDELIVYSGVDQIDLRTLTEFLNEEGAEALFTLLLDLYPNGSVTDAKLLPGKKMTEVADRFDSTGYQIFRAARFPRFQIKGGVRRRMFWGADAPLNSGPSLKKIPFVKWREGLTYEASTHAISDPVRLSQITGVLLHFKFFSDFAETAKREAARKDRPLIEEYDNYLRVMKEFPDLNFNIDLSYTYSDSSSLLNNRLMHVTAQYADWVRKAVEADETPPSPHHPDTPPAHTRRPDTAKAVPSALRLASLISAR